MRLSVAVLLAMLAMPGSAQMVYKCVSRDGHVTLTSEPCATDQKMTSAVHAPPERMTRERHEALQRRRLRDDANSEYLNRLAGHGPTTRSYTYRGTTQNQDRHARCAAARSRRDAARRQMGMKVRYQTVRELDEMVYDACK